MATPSPEPHSRSWLRLASDGSQVPEIDVRVRVHAALLAERESMPAVSMAAALLELLRLPATRLALAGGCAAAIFLCFAGWRTVNTEMFDPVAFTLHAGNGELFSADEL